MDSGELPHTDIFTFQNVLVTRYASDHLITLDDEVEHIWSAPRTVAKTLFLLLRYMVPIFLTAETISAKRGQHSRFGTPQVSSPALTPISPQTYAGWLSILISNFLILLRIWTTIPRAHTLIRWSLVFFVLMQIANFIVTTWVISTMIPVLIFDHAAGLCSFSSKPKVFALWAPGLLFEVVVFVMVCWNTLDRPRALGADTNARMTRVFVRDGLIYFAILFILRVANTVIAIVAPISMIFVVVFFIWAATTLTTSRLIINSRREAGTAERLRGIQEGPGQNTGDTRRSRSWK
ncbi:hypothetical protein DFH08DRAFT_930536 [Mycena albidolilacea]|uniref:DUF6533 domain-containing protein n=1 Tax=Mycena albidolilacea TaxID=1033008 RepID=A0AAD7AQB3_9AGAR|nr:hypothetical protein DFH08DRAFT_930536 [Mycena albidolilacea]